MNHHEVQRGLPDFGGLRKAQLFFFLSLSLGLILSTLSSGTLGFPPFPPMAACLPCA